MNTYNKICINLFSFAGRIVLARFRKRTRHAKQVNVDTLRSIVSRNALSKFGRDHGFAHFSNSPDMVNDFQKHVPLSGYADYESYIAEIMAGQTNVLTSDKVISLSGTSGTTSRPKRIPRTRRAQRQHVSLVALAQQAVINQGIPGASRSSRGINLMSMTVPAPTEESAVPIISGTNSGIRRMRPFISLLWASPAVVYSVKDPFSAYYLHALFGLQERDALFIESPFAPQVVNWLNVIWKYQDQLIADIRNGTLLAELAITAAERQQIIAALKPNKLRANEIEQALARGRQAMAARLWPDMCYVRTVMTGSFAVHEPLLRQLTGKDMVLQSGCHTASEGIAGINLNTDGNTDYTLAVGAGYFEFIPLAEIDRPEPTTLSIAELQVGHCYELVITNFAGFYRYRLGDVVRHSGYYNEAPTFATLYRRGTLLDLVGEKTTEFHTTKALQKAFLEVGIEAHQITDYTVHGKATSRGGQYEFFIELDEDLELNHAAIQLAATALDRALCEVNECYGSNGKNTMLLEPARIRLVKPRSFELLNNLRLARQQESSAVQLKTPRVLHDHADFDYLDQNVLA